MEYIRGNTENDPEEYLVAYQQRPYIEKLVKAGLSRLAMEHIKKKYSYHADEAPLSIQESSLIKLLGIDRTELQRLRQYNGGNRFLNWLQYEKASEKEMWRLRRADTGKLPV